MKKILISACLVGDRVRYDGRRVPVTAGLLKRWLQKEILLPFCPEVSGGLDTPRLSAQIVGGTGEDVLNKTACLKDMQGRDVTQSFVRGAELCLSLAKRKNIQIAVLKEKSPSCGVHTIYDGSFTEKRIPGMGVTAAILHQNGIQVFSENELDRIEDLIDF
jgi:uncharacterized protein YbbK (DUF523 family)